MTTCVQDPAKAGRLGRLRALEGRHVDVALRDGSRLDDCQVVSVGRTGLRSVWLVCAGADLFVAAIDIVDLWESAARPTRVA